jgi:predicted phosphodiesterase
LTKGGKTINSYINRLTVDRYVEAYRKSNGNKKEMQKLLHKDPSNLRKFYLGNKSEIERRLSDKSILPETDILESLRQAMLSEEEPAAKPQEPEIVPRDYLVPSEARIDHTTSENRLRIGIIADTHLCSKEQQLSHLKDFYRRAYDAGVRDIYHAGDIIAGVDVYPGQANDIFCHTEDDQIDYCVANYPSIEGITTHVISGNHDLVFVKRKGGDPLRSITFRRPDINYLGQFSAWIKLQENCLLYLLHPDGGSAYADSYRLQKLIESFEGGNKPNIAVMGHFHRRCYIASRNVHGFLGACFEGQTDFLRRKSVQPVIGGTILDVTLTDKGAIQDIGVKFRQYLVPKEKDY